MADYTLTLYQEDDTTPLFEVGTAASHAHPYLVVPEEFGEAEVDLLEGRAMIGQVNVRVIDPQSGVDQTERFLTALLGNASGYGALNFRRAVLKQVAPAEEVVQDGVCFGVTLTETFAGFDLQLRDIRERGRKVKVFGRTGTSTVLPRGVLNGYGALPSGGWLVAPTNPLLAEFQNDFGPTSGFFNLVGQNWISGSPYRGGDVVVPAGLAVTDAMIKATAPAFSRNDEEGYSATFPTAAVVWREIGQTAAEDWRWLRNIRSEGGAERAQLINYVENAYLGSKLGPRGRAAYRINASAATAGELPGDGDIVEVAVVYTGPASEDYPLHFEGTWGTFTRNLLRGDYCGLDENGDVIDPRLRYDEAALLAIQEPVRIRITEPADDLRTVLEQLCKAIGAAPALDNDGKISPIRYALPDPDVELAEIDDTNCQAIPGWDHPADSAITVVEVTYPRDYAVSVEQDPAGTRSAGDGIATQKVINRRAPADLMGEKELSIDAWMFRAIGGADGAPVSGDVTDETGALLTLEAQHRALDRFAYGGVSGFGRLAGAAFPGIREGSWAVDARSWRPDYQSGTRGGNSLVQIVALKRLNPAWYEARWIDAGPADNPLGQPTLGAVSANSDGVVSVPVSAVPAGGEARVDFAVSDTLPGTTSPLWTFLGRTAAEETLTSPALPAGSTVWVRARGEGRARRPSAWTLPVSITLAQVARVLSAGVSVDASGAVTVDAVVNAFALGLRIYYAVHLPEVTPTLSAYIDRSAGSLPAVLPVTLLPGQAITVEVEPWTGWTGSAVSGTAGARLPALVGAVEADAETYSILKVEKVEETDTTRTVDVFCGPGVDEVAVFELLLRAPSVGSIDAVKNGSPAPSLVVIDGVARVTLPRPPAGMELHVDFVALDAALDLRGKAYHYLVPPVPPKVEAEIHAEVIDDLADLTLSVTGSASVWPVKAEIFEDGFTGTLLLTHTFNAAGSIDAGTFPELAARPLPLREVRRWVARLTDIAGTEYQAKPAIYDRDSLPWGAVTPLSDVASPSLRIEYDDDTDTIRITTPAGATKTYPSLAGGGVVVYTVGTTLLDTTAAEAAMGVGEERGDYLVEIQGGGEWRTIFRGALRGLPAQAWIASASATFDESSDEIRLRATAGANSGSATLQISSDPTFATDVTALSTAFAGGATVVLPRAIVAAERDRRFYWRVRVYSGPLVLGVPTGLEGNGRSGEVYVPGVPKPSFGYIKQPSGSALLTDVELQILASGNQGGTLYVHTNKTGTADANPAALSAALTVASTPLVVGPTTAFNGGSLALHDITVWPGRGKTIYLRFLAADGGDTGLVPFKLTSWLDLVGSDGKLIDGAIDRPAAIAASFAPILRVASLPASGTRLDERVFRVSDASLWRWDGAAWQADTPAVGAYSYLPAVIANSVTAKEVATHELTAAHLNVADVFVSGLTITGLAWSACTVDYQGVTYAVASGSATGEVVWWKNVSGSQTVFQASATMTAAVAAGFDENRGDRVILIKEGSTYRQVWNGTRIYGGHLTTDIVQAKHVASLVMEVAKYIHSSNYATGVSGWAIEGDGSAEFNNVTIRGILAGVTGDFAGELSALTQTLQGELYLAGGWRSTSPDAGIIRWGTLPGLTMRIRPQNVYSGSPGTLVVEWKNLSGTWVEIARFTGGSTPSMRMAELTVLGTGYVGGTSVLGTPRMGAIGADAAILYALNLNNTQAIAAGVGSEMRLTGGGNWLGGVAAVSEDSGANSSLRLYGAVGGAYTEWARYRSGAYLLGTTDPTGAVAKSMVVGNVAAAPTSNPVGGGILFADAGAGKWRGTSGTVTTFGTAEPHCPACGADFMTEHENPEYGYLALCLRCLADELGDRPFILRSKAAA